MTYKVTPAQRIVLGDEISDTIEDRRQDGRRILVDSIGRKKYRVTWDDFDATTTTHKITNAPKV